jgi:dipeptidyl aminopeptidase/acylaminoacyl peptidase
VLARPEGAQRRGIYLYDLEHEKFGEPVAENSQFDVTAGFISRDGKRVQRYCFITHVQVCESVDGKLNAHMKGVRKYFKDSANVYTADSSDDNQTLLLFVEGPSDPPAYFYYRMEAKHIQRIGHVQESLAGKTMPTATLVTYQARDGLQLTGYLTRPSGAAAATQLPLIMMPHGGPELRDHLNFDFFVQYFASRGYAVFQPNFRGSDGFGRDFADSGHGQWGRKMQDDITDAVAMLIEQKVADPARVCIVGASYGGYAALAGAAFTPDLYKCVVAIAGPGDLREFLSYRLKTHGIGSELYAYWMRLIGDPKVDAERIAAVSPERHADQIKAPILLIHGDEDVAVPYDQSRDMKKALDKSGRKTRLITLKGEGHSFWSRSNLRLVLTSAGDFLEHNIGPGYGQTPENKQ